MRFSLLSFLSLPIFCLASRDQQIIMNNGATAATEPFTPHTSSQPTLADLLTIERSASIFYSYAREIELSTMFSDARARSTVFVPTNKAVMALARKPHQGQTAPSDEGIEISEQEFDAQSKKNVERWISAHIIPDSPISFDSQHDTLLEGKSISFTKTQTGGSSPEWGRVTLEDGVRIIDMKEGLNGVLYLIDGTVSYEKTP